MFIFHWGTFVSIFSHSFFVSLWKLLKLYKLQNHQVDEPKNKQNFFQPLKNLSPKILSRLSAAIPSVTVSYLNKLFVMRRRKLFSVSLKAIESPGKSGQVVNLPLIETNKNSHNFLQFQKFSQLPQFISFPPYFGLNSE